MIFVVGNLRIWLRECKEGEPWIKNSSKEELFQNTHLTP
jgi:hypothetical protein